MKSILSILLLLFSFKVFAHSMAPYLFEITEKSQKEVSVRWRSPATKIRGEKLSPIMPSHCKFIHRTQPFVENLGIETLFTYSCSINSLKGTEISVTGIKKSPSDVLLSIGSFQTLLNSENVTAVVPTKKNLALELFGPILNLA